MTRLGDLMRAFLQSAAPSASGTPQSAPDEESGIHYAPELDGAPDPGEVVWAWVPFDDDPTRGKDRPVLLVGRDGEVLLGLQLTSRDHDLDAEDEARHGRYWMDVGAGDWDRERRPSEVRLDRVVRLEAGAVRREGAVLDRATFDAVIREAHRHHDL